MCGGARGARGLAFTRVKEFRVMFFSMKRSLVVFVALGLMAGLVGCGGSGININGVNLTVDGGFLKRVNY